LNAWSESDAHVYAVTQFVGGVPPCPICTRTFSAEGFSRWHSTTRVHRSPVSGRADHAKRTSSACSGSYTASIFACVCVARLFGEQSTHRVPILRSLLFADVHSDPEIGFAVIVRLYRTYDIVVVRVAPLLYGGADLHVDGDRGGLAADLPGHGRGDDREIVHVRRVRPRGVLEGDPDPVPVRAPLAACRVPVVRVRAVVELVPRGRVASVEHPLAAQPLTSVPSGRTRQNRAIPAIRWGTAARSGGRTSPATSSSRTTSISSTGDGARPRYLDVRRSRSPIEERKNRPGRTRAAEPESCSKSVGLRSGPRTAAGAASRSTLGSRRVATHRA